MNTFAEYILNEENLISKMEITYYLSKKEKIFFDKSVIYKTELARLFLKSNKLDLDKNLILTACLLCNCKKTKNVTNIKEIHSYAKEGAQYLEQLGFDKKFCKMCQEVNRYSEENKKEEREKESDILELVDQFGGMILDRPERIGFKPDEAMVLLKHRNLKNEYNRYIEVFDQFVKMLEKVDIGDVTEGKAIKEVTKIYNESNGVINFIKRIVNDYEPKIDYFFENKYKIIEEGENSKRSLFTEETTRKIIGSTQKIG